MMKLNSKLLNKLLSEIYLAPKYYHPVDPKEFNEKQIALEDGFLLNYTDTEGDKPILLLIHGMSNNWEGWVEIIQSVKNQYRVIALDMPGYGKSDRLPRYDLNVMSDRINQFVMKLGLVNESKVLVGLSMGSTIILNTINKYPRLAKRVILLSPVFNQNTLYLTRKISHIFFRVIRDRRILKMAFGRFFRMQIVTYFLSKFFVMKIFDRAGIDQYVTSGKRHMDITAFIDMSISVSSFDMSHALRSVDKSIKIMMVFGKFDKLCNKNQAINEIGDLPSNVELIEIEDSGHIVTLEASSLVVNIVKKGF